MNEMIDQAVALEAGIAEAMMEAKAKRKAIHSLMIDAGLMRHAPASGAEALRYEQEAFSWKVPHLEAILNAEDLDELVPRKPDALKLRKRVESDEDFKRLAKGAYSVRTTERLEIRGAKIGTAVESEAA